MTDVVFTSCTASHIVPFSRPDVSQIRCRTRTQRLHEVVSDDRYIKGYWAFLTSHPFSTLQSVFSFATICTTLSTDYNGLFITRSVTMDSPSELINRTGCIMPTSSFSATLARGICMERRSPQRDFVEMTNGALIRVLPRGTTISV